MAYGEFDFSEALKSQGINQDSVFGDMGEQHSCLQMESRERAPPHTISGSNKQRTRKMIRRCVLPHACMSRICKSHPMMLLHHLSQANEAIHYEYCLASSLSQASKICLIEEIGNWRVHMMTVYLWTRTMCRFGTSLPKTSLM